MKLRRCDRYLLRQMLGPFVLAFAGLALFILLNLILQFSNLMVNRGTGLTQLIRLIVLWMPGLLSWAIPMAALFAVFLGLGRMEHDREIMALESIGVSLRRILLPLLIASLGVSFVTFAIYNWVMPASQNAAQRTYREILMSQPVPRISANTFFTGSNEQYYYVRQYNDEDGSVNDVLIYDVSGQLFPQAEASITMVTAGSGTWINETWQLSAGRVVAFDRDGVLIFSSTFDEMTIPVGQTADQIWAASKSPSEMRIAELTNRLAQARASGLPTAEVTVELHQRFALPLSTFLFVLVAGTVSLMFGSKSRSTGIIVGLLIIGLYQGAYFYLQTLGRQGVMEPRLAAWAPNVLFGLAGLVLYLRVDRLASRDTWARLRNRLPFLTSFMLLVMIGSSGLGQEAPLHLTCDDLFISEDSTEIIAQGTVRAELADAALEADSLYLKQDEAKQWHLEATGQVALVFDDFDLQGDRISASMKMAVGGMRATALEAAGFSGQSEFVNSAGENHTLYFHGESGLITFDHDGELERIEITKAELTTCNCCDRPFRSQPYTLRSNRLLFYPDQMIVAFGLTGKIGGYSTLWLPVYVQPLEETLGSPLFPAIGNSALRGWFLKWNLPFYFSESLYGSVLFDYFSRFNELGGGLIVKYEHRGHRGSAEFYAFPAVVGDAELTFSLDHSVTFSDHWTGSATIDYSLQGADESFRFAAQTNASLGDWSITSSASRSWKEKDDVVTERLPEFSLSRSSIDLGVITISPSLRGGWVREWQTGELVNQGTRLQGALTLATQPFHFAKATIDPSLSMASTHYQTDARSDRRSTISLSVPLSWDSLSVVYDGIFITGESPFDFDQIEAESHIGWILTRSGAIDIQLSSGIDLGTSLDPLDMKLAWGLNPAWAVSGSYCLSNAILDEVALQMDWHADQYSVSWSLPYDAELGSLSPLAFDIAADADRARLKLSGSIEDMRLNAISGSYSIQGDSGWGATISTSFDRDNPSTLAKTRYGVFKDIGDCLRVGLERGGGDIWIYGSILAFPEAILRYAPESARLQIGD